MLHPFHLFTHCPECGSPRFLVHDEKSKRCETCGFVYYFNPSAAVVALITDAAGRLLVCRRAQEPACGTLDLPGGFLDCFETAEEGIAREVREETGLTVDTAQYHFSLPNTYLYSGFTVHTLDLFFRCTVAPDAEPVAADDADQAFYVPVADLEPAAFGLRSISQGVARFKSLFP